MTNEEKQMLFDDINGRLSCGVIVHHKKINVDYKVNGALVNEKPDGEKEFLIYVKTLDNGIQLPPTGPCDVLPYLRPVSSMTKEELDKLNEIISKEDHDGYFFVQEEPYYYGLQLQTSDIGCVTGAGLSKAFDYLNSIHVDYRGLIPNLALEAPEGMYKFE